jgi:transketolase
VDAALRLAGQGISARVLNLRSLVPLDEEAVLRATAETRLVVTIEDHFATGGLATMLAELLMRRRRIARVLPIALENRWFRPALLNDVLATEGFTGAALAARIAKELGEIHG